MEQGGLAAIQCTERESGVGDSAPFFVRIGEKGSRNHLQPALRSLAVPGRMPLRTLDAVEDGVCCPCGKRTEFSASVGFARLRRHEMLRWPG